MNLALIVAMASNRVIGRHNVMPWHLSADLKRFKQITLNSPIVMGRKTYESIGRPLPSRTNIIVSSNLTYAPDGCLVFQTIEAALNVACQHSNNAFVIGGATLYEATLPLANTLYITQIHREFDGDTFFPEWHKDEWQEVQREDVDNDTAVDFSYSFLKFVR